MSLRIKILSLFFIISIIVSPFALAWNFNPEKIIIPERSTEYNSELFRQYYKRQKIEKVVGYILFFIVAVLWKYASAAEKLIKKQQYKRTEKEYQRSEEFKRRQSEEFQRKEEERRKQEKRRKSEEERRRSEEQNRRYSQSNFNESTVSDESYYASVLGFQDRVMPEDVKRRYKQLATQYHPDKVGHLGQKLKEVAEQEMIKINEAYEFFKKKYGLK